MLYFAYGSNMLRARLQRRVPSAERVGTAQLSGHQLRFNKIGVDGSGKCNAHCTGNDKDRVYGVVYEMHEAELPRLDAAEGVRYDRIRVEVEAEGRRLEAATYRAQTAWVDDAMAPYTWYLAFVTEGAMQHGLPGDYTRKIANTYARPDMNPLRSLCNRWILLRGAAENVARE